MIFFSWIFFWDLAAFPEQCIFLPVVSFARFLPLKCKWRTQQAQWRTRYDCA